MLALGIGRWVVEEHDGPVPIVNYLDPDLTDAEVAMFDRQPEMLEELVNLFGPYPFDSYGALVLDDEFPQAALETQSLSTFSRASLGFGQNVVVHEMAHQWFGDSVTLTNWQDIWLHEGFATYSEWLWDEADVGPDALDSSVRFAYWRDGRRGSGGAGRRPRRGGRAAARDTSPHRGILGQNRFSTRRSTYAAGSPCTRSVSRWVTKVSSDCSSPGRAVTATGTSPPLTSSPWLAISRRPRSTGYSRIGCINRLCLLCLNSG